jgi:HAD superfamily hydrolase (TIGR01509 family)
MTIRAIIFDYGEVLNATTNEEEVAFTRAEAAAELGIPPEELWTYLFDCEASKQWMTGELTWQEFWTTVLAPHGISDPEEVQAFSRRVLPVTTHLNPEMVQLLEVLKDRYALAIVSNASWKEHEMRKMFYNDFELPDDTFDAIVTSTSVGVVKPDKEIFRHALTRLGVKAEEAIFTDDMPQFTAAAASLGIHCHTFTSPARFRAYLATFGIVADV